MKIKRLLLILGLLTFTSLAGAAVTPSRVHAVDVLDKVCAGVKNGTPDVCKDNKGSGTNPLFGKSGVMTKAINILSRFVGIIAVIAVIIAGFMLTTAGGDPNKVATARRALTYALAGLAVALSAQLIVAFVLNSL
jgi:hypothetical protein